MLTYEQIILRLVLSVVLGGVVGLERERLDRFAGLRTHMLVCVGSTLFMIVSAFGFGDIWGHSNVALDPSRVAAQVASGIGFLGAGTIIFRREVVRGLTTAAGLWAVAAIGLSVGGGLYVAAVSTTVLVVIILAGVKPAERRLFPSWQPRLITLLIDRREVSSLAIESAIESAGLRLQNILIQPSDAPEENRVELTLSRAHGEKLTPLVEKLRNISGVREISHRVV